MRKLITIVLSALSLIILVTSCDKEGDKPLNQFTYQGATYRFNPSGIIVNWGENRTPIGQLVGTYNFDVYLYSPEISLNADGDFVGEGEMIYLWFNTTNAEELVSGTYTISANENGRYPANTITPAAFAINLKAATGKTFLETFETAADRAASGTVSVTKSGNQYTIVLDLLDADGNALKGTFTGVLN